MKETGGYGADSRYSDPDESLAWKHLNDRLDGLRQFAAALEDDKEYALVATEF